MGHFLSYSIVSGLLMLAMYLAYRAFLSGDNQPRFNRLVLSVIYIVSFLASPLLFPLKGWNMDTRVTASVIEGVAVAGVPSETLPQPLWSTVLIWIFIAGMVVVTARTLMTWGRLMAIVRSGTRIRHDGYTLVVTDRDNLAPFSWMNYVVIGRDDYEGACLPIITHEIKHVACRHWIDLLAAQVVCIIDWFNPAAWLMRDELMLVHEYQADQAVISGGHDIQEYQMLLIKKAVGSRFPSLANSLNHSKLKKRITMMYKEKSGAGRKFKVLALVPTLALALGVAGVPAVRAAVSTIGSSEISVGKGNDNLPEGQVTVRRFKVININNTGRETRVVIRGEGLGNSLTVSGATFTNGGMTYQANSLNFNMTDGVGIMNVTFPFSEEYRKPSMSIMVNGEEVPFDLEDLTGRTMP